MWCGDLFKRAGESPRVDPPPSHQPVVLEDLGDQHALLQRGEPLGKKVRVLAMEAQFNEAGDAILKSKVKINIALNMFDNVHDTLDLRAHAR